MTFFEFKVKKWSKIPDARCHCCVQAKSWYSDDEGVLKRRCLVHLTLARHETYTQQQHNIQQHHHLGHPMDKCVNKLAKLLVSHLWLCTYTIYMCCIKICMPIIICRVIGILKFYINDSVVCLLFNAGSWMNPYRNHAG